MYIHENKKWPEFFWNQTVIDAILSDTKFRQGKLLGRMENLGFSLQERATLETLTKEALKTSEIEGERLNENQVRSSIARYLGIEVGGLVTSDRHVDGLVRLLLDATRHYQQHLTAERLFGWHSGLFPTGFSDMSRIQVGSWRTDKSGPMQVISGAYGKRTVHFEAPSADRVPREMKIFLNWFETTGQLDWIIKSAIAHLWFVTIHPFDDGNGRIGRAVADMALARSEQQPHRFYSFSAQIMLERKDYYNQLESAQKGDLDITPWLEWFLQCLCRAIDNSALLLEMVLQKSRFWEQHSGQRFNERQIYLLNYLFDGFKGHLTSSKWAKIAKCSQDTANRDIKELLDKKVLCKSPEGGRSTHYLLCGFSINVKKS